LLNCKIPAHPPSKINFALSYNKIDWHELDVKFEYETCHAGYTSPTYKEPCTMCPPGTFKPTSGLYDCLKCGNGTYNSFAGAITCEKCPDNTTGIAPGAISHEECYCDKGFFVNPNYVQHSGAHKKCITCPEGAFCNFNTTEPLALPGYWNSFTQRQSFYSCTPKESCGGFSPENCTSEYKGIRCGNCVKGSYKFRGKCSLCGPVETTWLRLIGILGGLALITAIFFALSSTKVHHIASIAIAFSFWQVLSMFAKFDIQWPSLIGGTLTASSVSNFNTDFLSPNCIFPNIDYVTLWTLQMLMPIYFLVSFGILYILLIVRSINASILSNALKLIKINITFIRPLANDSVYEEETEKKRNFFTKLIRTIRNIFTTILNLFIWTIVSPSSGRELVKILNRIINGFFAFLSFSFIFIMTTASEVFVCTKQPDGVYTLNSSPDIRCYQDTTWFTMMPLTLVWYIIFGGGSAVYFILIYFKYSVWSKQTNFRERNKFMLSRFRNKLFFWEAVITLRKTILSILYIFLDEMLVIVCGIFLLYAGFLLHTNFVPFKRKFHNVMDYFVIIVTMTTLFFGLLFFVDRFPEGTKGIAEYVAFLVIIGSTIIVVSMILWDANTRRKNDKKKLKAKLKKINDFKEHEEDTRKLLIALHEKEMNDDLFHVKIVPWEVDYDYKPIEFKTDSETPEENFSTMNDIFYDLLSPKRIYRKIFLLKRKGLKTSNKIIKKFKKKSPEEKQIEQDLIKLQNEDPLYQEKLSEDKKVGDKKMERKLSKADIQHRKSQLENEKTNSIVSLDGNLKNESVTVKLVPRDAKKDDKKEKRKTFVGGNVTVKSKLTPGNDEKKRKMTKEEVELSDILNDLGVDNDK
jgi:hypothetical protein